MRYRFGAVELDPAAYTLRREGREIGMQPKMFDLLRYLIERRDRVVSKDELLDALWPGEHVGEAAVVWTVSHVRNALGQGRGQKQPIETIHGRGYRFRGAIEVVAATLAPVEALHGDPATALSAAPPARPFVGRAEVMRRLEALLKDAIEGRGHLCLLHGEAGIGKTRCAEELMRTATRAGLNAWGGRAVEGAGAPVFWPWIQILRDAVQTRPELRGAGEPLLSRLAALDRASSGADEPAAERRVLAGRFWLLDDVSRFLLHAAKEAPAVLLIDDLQWADSGTLDLLGFLATELASARMLVVATARETAAGELGQALHRLARHAERIELTRLSPEDIGHYIAELTAQRDAPPPLVLAVHRATAGNPLFVQETVRTLLAEHGKEALGSMPAAEIRPPEVARDVLQARLAPLGAEARSLLACASVLGEEFDLSLLQTVSGLQLAEVLALIEAADRQGLIVAETPQRCCFSHGLIRQLLYDEMKTAERIALHRRAAEALEAMRTAEPRHSEIAHHFYRSLPAGAYDRVTAAAKRAAAAAEAVFAFADAVRFYEWALEAQSLDGSVPVRERAELLLDAGEAQRQAGRDGDARRTLARLFELAREHRYPDLLVRGARTLRPTFAMASVPDPAVRGALEDVLKMTPEQGSAPRIRALSLLSCVPPYANDMTRSKQMSSQALELARGSGARPLLMEALRSRFYSLCGPDDIDALLAATDEVFALEADRPTPVSVEAHCARAGALLYRGEITAADQAFEAVGRIAAELKYPEMIWYHHRQVAQRRFLDGHFDAAEAACEELRAQSKRLGLSYGQWFTDVLRRAIAVERNGRQVAGTGYDFAALTRPGLELHVNIKSRMTRAAAELGRVEIARLGVDALAAAGFDTIPKDIAYLYNLANISIAVLALSDGPRAEQLYALLAPYSQHNTPDAMLLYEGSVSRYLAQLAACLGWSDKAEAHFEAALVMNRRIGQRALVARTSHEYAQWLAGRRSAGARTRAQELNRETVALAENLGMAWLAERARSVVEG